MTRDGRPSTNPANWFQPGRRELPHADETVEPGLNEWAWLRHAQGKTASESKLLQLVRGSVLSLWSYPGPFLDHGLSRNGGGKELCDLLVIFGNNVIVFSDKECSFPACDDAQIAWARWYRRAIGKSAKQLVGARSSLRKGGTQLFSDATCKVSLPVHLPAPECMRLHLVAVAHGSVKAAEQYWEKYGGAPGSSGSLMLNTRVVGEEHLREPFHVGWPAGKEHFIHVLDTLTLQLLLQELDTVGDFTDYLAKKEALVKDSGCEFLIPGEEELLTGYLTNIDNGRVHHFPHFPPGSHVVMREGSWVRFLDSPLYRIRAEANTLSHLWDDLIEYQASHIIHGSAQDVYYETAAHNARNSEHLLRVMASENRLTRRFLGATLREGRDLSSNQKRWFRTIAAPERARMYCLVFLPYYPEQQHEEYRQYRQYLLRLYCEGALLRFPQAKEIVGVAPAPYDSELVSVDFILLQTREDTGITAEDRVGLERELSAEGIWDPAVLQARSLYDVVYPAEPPSPLATLGRAARRLAAKLRRRGSRKRGPDSA